MNERIKELAYQAEQYAYTDNVGMQCQLWRDKFQTKFAESIVLEMCNVLDKEQWNIGRDWICDDGTRIIPKVKEHFGVEE